MPYFRLALVLCFIYKPTNCFNLGLRGTKCSLDYATFNDPCNSLYWAVCDGEHCKCPTGTLEDKVLKKCKKSTPPRKSETQKGFDWDDLPFEYTPDSTPASNPFYKDTTTARPGTTFNNTTGYPKMPSYPQQPGHPGRQPKTPYPSSNDKHKPIVFPDDPKYGRNNPSDMSNDVGGGIGGGIGIIIFAIMVYFCCCRGNKGKTIRTNIMQPFVTRNGATVNQGAVIYQMQEIPIRVPGQQGYVPQQPGQPIVHPQQPGQVYPPLQPGPIYPPQQPSQIYPPPQPTQIYPPQQPTQMYPLQPGQMYPPQQPGQLAESKTEPPAIGFASPPPPYSLDITATAPPPTA